jgi:error-prone DNA polymerase
MGFYQPAQIVGDARKHGVEALPVDINYSMWDHILIPANETACEKNSDSEKRGMSKDGLPPGPAQAGGMGFALRLGFRQVKGIREGDMQLLISARTKPFTGIHELRHIGLTDAALEKLADADAFRSIGLDRRQALWQVSVKDTPVCIFAGQASPEERFSGKNETAKKQA